MATVEEKKTDTVTIEVDGRELSARKGEMIIQVTDRAGIDIPRFCYHEKLSVAASCRMCLVDVEKIPKPLPACATPVHDGMKVFTRSRRAIDAQRGVMEFLLINHPLDCPICDQGGECELQDLAMGYGRSVSRFTERKRVVRDKNLGPLVATDMTRCIHCTRCTRFLSEIAGTAELGSMNRGEHHEISTFIERNIESELSGNIIDLCPVGALTNKPFRHTARPWEMRARPHVGSHDCLGSHLYYHVRAGRIMRAVPRSNEAINECWLADRDRYGHCGLASADRLTAPRIRVDGQWQETDWDTALEAAANSLQQAGKELGVLMSPRATTEEHLLAARLTRGLGSENIDHRLRVNDFSHPLAGLSRLDRPTRDLSEADAIFLVGSNIRQDQPILGHRVRTAWRKRDAKIVDLNPVAYDFHFNLAERLIVAPQAMVDTLGRVAKAAVEKSGHSLPDGTLGNFIAAREPDSRDHRVAELLNEADNGIVLLGDGALNHARSGWLRGLAEWLAEALGVGLMILPGPANSAGAAVAGALPGQEGLDARAMLREPRRAYLLWDLEPGFDLADPHLADSALQQAESVIAVTAFVSEEMERLASVMLPLAPVPETAGTWINADGHREWLDAVGKPPGQAREGWKILRRLGEMASVDGFDFATLNEVSDLIGEHQPVVSGSPELEEAAVTDAETLWRIGDVPIYAGDTLLRRAPALQQTTHAGPTRAHVHSATAKRLGLEEAERVRVTQGEASVEVPLVIDDRIAPGGVWLPAASCVTHELGAASGEIRLEACP
ncbi:NADH-quinone oxidoreductase subunit G [Wenzhouxiangella sp. AB-CW3]|uniref:NADH-quinone oxidoreductase subunit NuoG n=1 Tax=Wenzhouxiangella sp. AB-CW3 TaxID=2771012 RepID=UPI00168A7E65|nr:NADH-quinone oxidoreductase subunit NuoG [Wenzhouxiangella sp. AB-CW3]QOC22084.1 NADH-quinone oxidoreductase subunit G [Wenzhouxiangella sp. AB-CW3]